MIKIIDKNHIKEFLIESNNIEREYSEEGYDDAKKAWDWAISQSDKDMMSVDYILNIHKILMQRLRPDIAGKVRHCAVIIGNTICKAKSEKNLKSEIKIWIENYSIKRKEEEVKFAHVMFEHIHPFEDGNGRTGRILLNIQRLNADLPILIIHEGKEQMKYYKWFD